jgi:hypothetical protein
VTAGYSADEAARFTTFERGQWCGYRVDSISSLPSQLSLDSRTTPVQIHETVFYVPVDGERAAHWSVRVPEAHYSRYEDDITEMINTATVERIGTVG